MEWAYTGGQMVKLTMVDGKTGDNTALVNIRIIITKSNLVNGTTGN